MVADEIRCDFSWVGSLFFLPFSFSLSLVADRNENSHFEILAWSAHCKWNFKWDRIYFFGVSFVYFFLSLFLFNFVAANKYLVCGGCGKCEQCNKCKMIFLLSHKKTSARTSGNFKRKLTSIAKRRKVKKKKKWRNRLGRRCTRLSELNRIFNDAPHRFRCNMKIQTETSEKKKKKQKGKRQWFWLNFMRKSGIRVT